MVGVMEISGLECQANTFDDHVVVHHKKAHKRIPTEWIHVTNLLVARRKKKKKIKLAKVK